MDFQVQGWRREAAPPICALKRLLWLIVIHSLILVVSRAVHADDEQTSSPRAAAVSEREATSTIMDSLRHDAALADVQFVDRSNGWAVGDRGVIWHTDDGGATWRQQMSGVSCRLTGVCFIDSRRGWIVGGKSWPFGTASRGVVLRTDDGGATWRQTPGLILPLLTRVRFFDANRGIAVGQATAFCPSGVVATQDGGASWQPLPANGVGGWLTGDFLDGEAGAVAGSAGRFATLVRRQIVPSPLSTPSLHSYHAMRLLPPTGGWLVGDGGLVMTTNDLGHSWQTPAAELPEPAREQFDFQAVAGLGSHVWVAGSPGTRVFHSPDGGRTWTVAPTDQAAPLRALAFVDAEHGWAVGDLGRILVTHDGGRSWQLQRAGARRVALLGLFTDAKSVPLELFAEAGAAEGYVAAVDILYSPPANAGAELAIQDRTREAMLAAGAAVAETGWRFPPPPDDLALSRDDVLAALDRANDGRAIEQLESHLVRRLRMWRPDVVVTHHVALDDRDPRAAVLAGLLMRSIADAADPAWRVELADGAGLPPWQVKKVYGVLPAETRGAASIATGRFTPVLGATLSDFVSQPRHLLAATSAARPDSYELDLLMSRVPGDGGQRGVFSGISIAHGSEARRPQVQLPVNDLADLRRMASRRRHLAELLERSEGNAAWAGQVVHLTEDLSANDGAELLVQLADGYRATGRLDMAADTYYLLARRFPDHPCVDRALIWLVQFYASQEAGQRTTSRGAADIRQTSFEDSDATAPAVGLSRDDRLRRAIQLTDYLKTVRPELFAEPALRFAEVAAQRQLGFANPAKRYYLTLRQLPERDPWRQCAETEEWLAQPAELPPPKVFGACRPAPEPPHLDGQLDETCWAAADRLRLRGDATGSEVRSAYDAEFLYVAIHCPKVPGGDYEPDDRPRPRDADLGERDRVTLRLDMDRDYATAYELTVDHRGWTSDACWGDAHWNPNWYVAAASDEASWTIEAAVPLAELTAEPPAARHVWALSARRTIPRVGYESWAGGPADSDSPSRFGLLLFE